MQTSILHKKRLRLREKRARASRATLISAELELSRGVLKNHRMRRVRGIWTCRIDHGAAPPRAQRPFLRAPLAALIHDGAERRDPIETKCGIRVSCNSTTCEAFASAYLPCRLIEPLAGRDTLDPAAFGVRQCPPGAGTRESNVRVIRRVDLACSRVQHFQPIGLTTR